MVPCILYRMPIKFWSLYSLFFSVLSQGYRRTHGVKSCVNTIRLLQVAVGMPVSRHPPHRSQACGTTALGSCLRSDAEALVLPLVPWSKRSTLLPTSVCRSRSLVQSFPWPGAFSPRTPPVVGQFMLVEHLCSLASQILRPRPTSQARSCRTYGL